MSEEIRWFRDLLIWQKAIQFAMAVSLARKRTPDF